VKRTLTLLAGLIVAAPAALSAQAFPAPAPEPSLMRHGESFENFLFPPEVIMQRQRELALTPQQRTTITEAVKALQSGVVDLQWQLQDEQAKVHESLGRPTVDEAAVLAQVDRVLELERGIKRLHLQMLIRIKNALTPEQQERLREVNLMLWKGHEELHELPIDR
jgi:Spy/CpxP family protein refolding chaperone